MIGLALFFAVLLAPLWLLIFIVRGIAIAIRELTNDTNGGPDGRIR